MNDLPHFPFAEGPGLDPPPEYLDFHTRTDLPEVRLPSGRRAALAFRYEDVRKVLGDNRFSRAAYGDGVLFAREPESLALMRADPPVHTRRRDAVTATFTARRAERLRPRLTELAGAIIDDIRAAGPVADLVGEFTVPFSLAVISELLGVPDADRWRFRAWTNAMMSSYGYSPEAVADAHGKMHAYFTDLVDLALRDPDAPGLVGELCRLPEDERGLTRDETIVMAMGLLIAGYDTTSNQLASFVYLLLSERERWEFLLADPGAVNNAIEEMLRWTSVTTTGGTPHVATADVELATTTVRAGEVVVPLTHTADRDPAVFGDPATLDLTRPVNPHLAFGYGRHRCLGAELARVELQVGLTALLRELPELAIAVPESRLRWRRGMQFGGLWELPVRWTGAGR
jgi:cytochrome P450